MTLESQGPFGVMLELISDEAEVGGGQRFEEVDMSCRSVQLGLHRHAELTVLGKRGPNALARVE